METSKLNRLVTVMTSTLSTVLELGVSVVLNSIFGTLLFSLWLINLLVRAIIGTIFKFQARNGSKPKVTLVSDGADAIWAYQKPGNSRNIIILYIYNSRMPLDTFRRLYSEKVINGRTPQGARLYEKLTTIFKKKWGYYCWEECKNFDISNHIRNIYEGQEDRIVLESEVLKYLPTLVGDMTEDKPQWEEILIPKFAYDDDMKSDGCHGDIPERSARIYRSHHAFMDGCSNLLMAGTCMSDAATFPYVLNPLSPLNIANWRQVLFKVTCIMFSLTTVIKTFLQASRIQSRFLMERYSGNQNFTWSPALDLRMLKSVKEKTNVSIPAILSSATIGALRRFEEKFPKKQPSTKNVTWLGLVGAILPYPDTFPKNRFTIVNFTSSGGRSCDDRLACLASTQRDMRKLTQSPEGLVAYYAFQIVGKCPAFIIQKLMGSAKTPLIYSNVPFASQRIKLWDQEVNDIAGWMPLLTFAGIGFLTVTYAGKVRICVIADEQCVCNEEVQFFLDQVQKEIQLLFEDCREITQFKDNISAV